MVIHRSRIKKIEKLADSMDPWKFYSVYENPGPHYRDMEGVDYKTLKEFKSKNAVREKDMFMIITAVDANNNPIDVF